MEHAARFGRSRYRRAVWGICCSVLLGLLLTVLSGCTPTLQIQNAPTAAPAAEETTEPEETATASVPGAELTEHTLTVIVTYCAFVAEICGAVVIVVAVVRGLLRYVPHIFGRQREDETYTEGIRLQLGKSLALALEFLLGADILRTAVAPTLSIILQTAAIAAIRTFLNYFLDRELREADRRREEQGGEGPSTPGVYAADGSDVASTQR